MIGWLTEKGRGNLEIPGWSGVQSLPRVLSLEQDEMYMRPLKEVEMLREGGECFNDLRIQGVWESPVRGKAAKILFLDYSVLEVFINDRGVISTRVYPDGEDSNAVRVRAEDALIRKLEVFSMKAASITCNDR